MNTNGEKKREREKIKGLHSFDDELDCANENRCERPAVWVECGRLKTRHNKK